ncbi:hypothetical protein LY78DRAFT_69126 [Colletotrichum sublineola]|nr:hypothetical protein LY78DRAFT_69126 [Colletotrichum sublineola]
MYLCLQAWPVDRDIEAGNETKASNWWASERGKRIGQSLIGACYDFVSSGPDWLDVERLPPSHPFRRRHVPSSSISTSPSYQLSMPLLSRVSPRPVSHRKGIGSFERRAKLEHGTDVSTAFGKISPCRARSYEPENLVRSHQPHKLAHLCTAVTISGSPH